MRFEVWFKDGLFRAFPNVQFTKKEFYSALKDSNLTYLTFAFGEDGTHEATINMKQVNFVEFWKE